MDLEVMSSIVESSASLATLVAGGTVTAIKGKMQSLKSEKNIEKIRAEYDEMITKILQERTDAILLAQTYKAELERIQISDEDIVHLQNTFSNVLDIMKNVSPNTPIDSFETIKDLISVDTLKTMQLLGFNYKAAIGEPLTEICADAIKKLAQNRSNSNNQNRRNNH